MKTLRHGSSGNEVARLQALLCAAGFPTGPIDGAFGYSTERAVRACQAAQGLPATGEAGRDTQTTLGMDKPDTTHIPVPVIARVTPDMVADMFAAATPWRNIERHLPFVLSALKKAGLDDRDLVLMALATVRAESEGFDPIDERISPFNTDPDSHPFNRYDHRLGNRGRPEGERYRGRGFIQLTGRTNYERYGKRVGLGLRLIEKPELANDPELAARILAEFIKDKRSLAKYAILGQDLKTARRLINGGSHGYDRFAAAFAVGERLLA